MSVPFLSGLVDVIEISSVGEADSGFGTIEESLTSLISGLKARFTRLTSEEEQKFQGRDSQRMWKVITVDTTVMEDITKVYKVTKGGEVFSVLYTRRQRDSQGVYHHVSMVVEKD